MSGPVYWLDIITRYDIQSYHTLFELLIFTSQVVAFPQCQLVLASFHGFTWRREQSRALGNAFMYQMMAKQPQLHKHFLYTRKRQLVRYSWEVAVSKFTANILVHPVPPSNCCVMTVSHCLCWPQINYIPYLLNKLASIYGWYVSTVSLFEEGWYCFSLFNRS